MPNHTSKRKSRHLFFTTLIGHARAYMNENPDAMGNEISLIKYSEILTPNRNHSRS